MINLTEAVNVKGYETFWGAAQSSVVIFRDGNVLEILPLDKNTEEEAILAARRWFSLRFGK